MKKQATIRQATSADAQSILALIKELAVFEREPDAVVLTLKTWFEMALSILLLCALLPRMINKL